MKCHNCGWENKDGIISCENCKGVLQNTQNIGYSQQSNEIKQPNRYEFPPIKKESNLPIVIVTLILIILMLCCCGVGTFKLITYGVINRFLGFDEVDKIEQETEVFIDEHINKVDKSDKTIVDKFTVDINKNLASFNNIEIVLISITLNAKNNRAEFRLSVENNSDEDVTIQLRDKEVQGLNISTKDVLMTMSYEALAHEITEMYFTIELCENLVKNKNEKTKTYIDDLESVSARFIAIVDEVHIVKSNKFNIIGINTQNIQIINSDTVEGYLVASSYSNQLNLQK